MQRILIIIYVIVTALIALFTTILEIQPALFFIEFTAPNPGDKYSVTFVLLVTWLIFLLPLMVVLLISKVFRTKPTEVITLDRTGVFVTRQKTFQSAMVGIPIFIDAKKVGVVDNGKTNFFDVPVGNFIIQAGEGKQASEKLEAKVNGKDQLNFSFSLKVDGLFTKIELTEVVKI